MGNLMMLHMLHTQRLQLAERRGFEEDKHPRASDGKFGSGNGATAKKGNSKAAVAASDHADALTHIAATATKGTPEHEAAHGAAAVAHGKAYDQLQVDKKGKSKEAYYHQKMAEDHATAARGGVVKQTAKKSFLHRAIRGAVALTAGTAIAGPIGTVVAAALLHKDRTKEKGREAAKVT